MHGLLALTPLALALPLLAAAAGPVGAAGAQGPARQCEARAMPRAGDVPHSLNPFTALRDASTAQQIRIEQRVVIRVTPPAPSARRNLLAELPPGDAAPRYEEKRKEKCVPLEDIAAVQTGSGNRLVLFMRDRRMLSVNLEKSCLARDFYSGFYVEKSKDGRLCVSRDRLQSRTGASCEVETIRQLVARGG